MAETKTIGRILPYEAAQYEEKISKFILRVNEQIQVLKIAIQNGNVNNSQTSKNFAKKAERFLETPFFLVEENKKKKVKHLKAETKINVGVRKDLVSIVSNWVDLKRSQKIVTAKKYSPYDANSKVDFISEIKGFYSKDVEFLDGELTRYSSEQILLNRLVGILADKEFLKAIGCKNSWEVSTLKKELVAWGMDQSFKAEEELQEVLTLSFFTDKKYLSMDVATFKEAVGIRAEIVKRITDWINTYKSRREAAQKIVESKKEEFKDYKLYDLFVEYDEFIQRLTEEGKKLKDEYSLYRFGQGLIEADVFASLYK